MLEIGDKGLRKYVSSLRESVAIAVDGSVDIAEQFLQTRQCKKLLNKARIGQPSRKMIKTGFLTSAFATAAAAGYYAPDQLMGLTAMGISFAAGFYSDNKHVRAIASLAGLLFTGQYLVQESYPGATMAMFATLRPAVFSLLPENKERMNDEQIERSSLKNIFCPSTPFKLAEWYNSNDPADITKLRKACALGFWGMGATAITSVAALNSMANGNGLTGLAIGMMPVFSMTCGTLGDFISSKNSNVSRLPRICGALNIGMYDLLFANNIGGAIINLKNSASRIYTAWRSDIPKYDDASGKKMSRTKRISEYWKSLTQDGYQPQGLTPHQYSKRKRDHASQEHSLPAVIPTATEIPEATSDETNKPPFPPPKNSNGDCGTRPQI